MGFVRRIWRVAALGIFALSSGSAFAEIAHADETVVEGPHRLYGEIGAFILGKRSESPGPAFGVGYEYRAFHGIDVGVGVRYQLVPGSHYEDPGAYMLFVPASLRGYFVLGRLELGLTTRVGLLAVGSKSGVCCAEVALAPDLRVQMARSTALQFAPELAIGTTGNHNGPNTEDYVDVFFGQAAVWLTVVQSL